MSGIALGEHYEKFIQKQLESGRYNNASEVVRAGLRLLEVSEVTRERWLREEIPSRIAEMESDPSIGIPAEQLFDKLMARKPGAGQ